MSFLAPLFLLGALAIALPFLFHLTRRNTRQKQSFSSLLFLRQTPPRLTRRNRLEHILLLLLRCAVISLLAVAFARPFFQRPVPILPESSPPTRSVLLLDTSASMRRNGVWAGAIARARESLANVSPTDEVALLTFDRNVRLLVGFEQWREWNVADRVSLTLGMLADVTPGWAATHLDNSLGAAIELLDEADARTDNVTHQRIILITDLQAGARIDGIQSLAWPANLSVTVESIKPAQPGNAGIHWLADSDPNLPSPDTTFSRVRVSNSADSRDERFQIVWNNTPESSPLHVHVPPGESRVVQAPTRPDTTNAGQLRLIGDTHAFDDLIHVLTPAPEEINLTFLGDDSPDDPRQLLYYLRRAFPKSARRIIQLTNAPLDATLPEIDPRSVRMVIATGPVPDSNARQLRRFMESGGTLLTVLRQDTANALLQSLAPRHEWNVEEAPPQDYAILASLDFAHPLLAAFADPRYSDFTGIRFWHHRRLNLEHVPEVRVVARFDRGDPALIELPQGQGRMFILTTGWQPSDGQLALSSKFPPLLHALLDLAGGSTPPMPQYRVGEEVNLSAATARARIRLPDQREITLNAGESHFTGTDLPGIYTVTAGTRSWKFAVNLDPAETRTTPIDPDDLERLGAPLQVQPPDPTRLAARQKHLHQAELENRQKLWRWLVLGTLLLLLLESWLAGRLSRPAQATA